MLQRFDDLLLRYAKWQILVMSFFGFDRRQAMNISITVGSISTGLMPFVCFHEPRSWLAIISMVVYIAYIWYQMKKEADNNFRDDDILSANPEISNNWFRLGALFIWTAGMSICLGIWNSPSLYLNVLMAKILLPCYLWPWFILNQGTKSKVTFRGLVTGWIAFAKTALTPQPIPQPEVS